MNSTIALKSINPLEWVYVYPSIRIIDTHLGEIEYYQKIKNYCPPAITVIINSLISRYNLTVYINLKHGLTKLPNNYYFTDYGKQRLIEILTSKKNKFTKYGHKDASLLFVYSEQSAMGHYSWCSDAIEVANQLADLTNEKNIWTL